MQQVILDDNGDILYPRTLRELKKGTVWQSIENNIYYTHAINIEYTTEDWLTLGWTKYLIYDKDKEIIELINKKSFI